MQITHLLFLKDLQTAYFEAFWEVMFDNNTLENYLLANNGNSKILNKKERELIHEINIARAEIVAIYVAR